MRGKNGRAKKFGKKSKRRNKQAKPLEYGYIFT
jgi:hypothetical protein